MRPDVGAAVRAGLRAGGWTGLRSDIGARGRAGVRAGGRAGREPAEGEHRTQRGHRQFGEGGHRDGDRAVRAGRRGHDVEPGVHGQQRGGGHGGEPVPGIPPEQQQAGGGQAERLQAVQPGPGGRPVRRPGAARQLDSQPGQPRDHAEPGHQHDPAEPAGGPPPDPFDQGDPRGGGAGWRFTGWRFTGWRLAGWRFAGWQLTVVFPASLEHDSSLPRECVTVSSAQSRIQGGAYSPSGPDGRRNIRL